MMEFRLSRSLFMNFSFSHWNLGYHRAFSQIFLHDGILAVTKPSHELFFHTMEFWLSRSLLTNFSFTRWNSGYYEAFSRTFLSYNGFLAITEPFHELFFFTMESRLSQSLFTKFLYMLEFWLSRSLLMNFSFIQWSSAYHEAFSRTFLSHDGILAITKPSHELFLFHTGISAIMEPFHESQWNSQNA
jgi:hypothetical protein